MVENTIVDPKVSAGRRWRFQLDNHLGTATLEVDHEGNVISYEEYHPYGTSAVRVQRSAAGFSQKRYRYTGKERDEETGLYYHGARYYAPWLGRWTAVDPAWLREWAGSSERGGMLDYCANSPVAFDDPDGKAPRPSASVGLGTVMSETSPSRAVVAINMAGTDTHGSRINEFLRVNYGATRPQKRHGETRATLQFSGESGIDIIRDIGRAADTLRAVKSDSKTIEVAGHSNSQVFARSTVVENGVTMLVGGVSNQQLAEVLEYRRGLAKRVSTLSKAKADGSSQYIDDAEREVAEFRNKNQEAAIMSEELETVAKKLELAGVEQVNLQSCRAGDDANPLDKVGLSAGAMTENLKKVLSTQSHKVRIGAHKEDLVSEQEGRRILLRVGETGEPHSASLPAPEVR
ncbi:MAG: RHS repeat-associated core domain-containing protein [Polyangiaceae bacterium]